MSDAAKSAITTYCKATQELDAQRTKLKESTLHLTDQIASLKLLWKEALDVTGRTQIIVQYAGVPDGLLYARKRQVSVVRELDEDVIRESVNAVTKADLMKAQMEATKKSEAAKKPSGPYDISDAWADAIEEQVRKSNTVVRYTYTVGEESERGTKKDAATSQIDPRVIKSIVDTYELSQKLEKLRDVNQDAIRGQKRLIEDTEQNVAKYLATTPSGMQRINVSSSGAPARQQIELHHKVVEKKPTIGISWYKTVGKRTINSQLFSADVISSPTFERRVDLSLTQCNKDAVIHQLIRQMTDTLREGTTKVEKVVMKK